MNKENALTLIPALIRHKPTTKDNLQIFEAYDGGASSYTVSFEEEHSTGLNCIHTENLEKLYFDEGVLTIARKAFEDCKNLKKVYLPTTLEELSRDSFSNMEMVLSQNPFLKEEEGILYNIVSHAALFAVDRTKSHYILKEGTTYIGANCFASCKKLESIVLPDSLLAVGNNAFLNCRQLEDIELPSSVMGIGTNAFHNTGIVFLSIPRGCLLFGSSL